MQYSGLVLIDSTDLSCLDHGYVAADEAVIVRHVLQSDLSRIPNACLKDLPNVSKSAFDLSEDPRICGGYCRQLLSLPGDVFANAPMLRRTSVPKCYITSLSCQVACPEL